MAGKTELNRRRRKAVAMRESGMTVRAIAAALGVSHPTVLRDIRAVDDAEAEAVLAVLAGTPPAKPPAKLKPYQRLAARGSKWERHYLVRQLHERGFSLRAIAGQVGASPATVLRDLRRSASWAADQADREFIRERLRQLRRDSRHTRPE